MIYIPSENIFRVLKKVLKRNPERKDIETAKAFVENAPVVSSLSGRWVDIIENKKEGKKRIIGPFKNVIVLSARHLVASLLSFKPKSVYGYEGRTVSVPNGEPNTFPSDDWKPLVCWAVGSGDNSGLGTNVSMLASEIGRRPVTYCFVSSATDFTGESADHFTEFLRVSAIFDTSHCNGSWTEWGIFGGNAKVNADNPEDPETLNTGLLLNYRTHGVFQKTDEITVTRILILQVY